MKELPAITMPSAGQCQVKVVQMGTKSAPVMENFSLIPKFNPILQQYIVSVSWNCVAQTFQIEIKETPKFEAFAWFSTINERQSEIQRNAFSDLASDAIELSLMDEHSRVIAKFKLQNNKLIDHALILYKLDPNVRITDLSHTITVHYEEIIPMELEPDTSPISPIDTEWAT